MNPNKTRRHNANRCPFAKQQATIYALANHESIESIRRTLHASRHTVLAIREHYPHEIEAAQEDIKDRIAMAYAKKSLDALDIIGQRIAAERSPLKQFRLYDGFEETIIGAQKGCPICNKLPRGHGGSSITKRTQNDSMRKDESSI
jgi:hypothetical protein